MQQSFFILAAAGSCYSLDLTNCDLICIWTYMHGCDAWLWCMATNPKCPQIQSQSTKIFSRGHSPKHYHVTHADSHNNDHRKLSIHADLQLVGPDHWKVASYGPVLICWSKFCQLASYILCKCEVNVNNLVIRWSYNHNKRIHKLIIKIKYSCIHI